MSFAISTTAQAPGKSFYHRIRPDGVRGSLHSAAAAGNLTDLQRLIAGGAAVNRATLGGVAPLHMAAHNGHAEAIARLLSARAEVNQLAPGGTTALHLGLKFGGRFFFGRQHEREKGERDNMGEVNKNLFKRYRSAGRAIFRYFQMIET